MAPAVHLTSSALVVSTASLAPRSIDNAWGSLAAWSVVFPAVGTLTVFARILLRAKYGIKLGWDDLMIVLAMPCAWGSWGAFFAIYYDVLPTTMAMMRPIDLKPYLRQIFMTVEFSVTAVNLVKISILCFYLRAFGTTKTARRWVWALLVINLLYGFLRTFYYMFTCHPPSAFWNDPTQCHGDMFLYWFITAIVGAATEIAIWAFPLPFIWKLQVPIRQKLALGGLFCLGIGVVLSCILRIYCYLLVSSMAEIIGSDRMSSMLQLMQQIETNLGMIVANLPAMHSPLRKLVKSLMKRIHGKQAVSPSTAPYESPVPQAEKKPVMTVSEYNTKQSTVISMGSTIITCKEDDS